MWLRLIKKELGLSVLGFLLICFQGCVVSQSTFESIRLVDLKKGLGQNILPGIASLQPSFFSGREVNGFDMLVNAASNSFSCSGKVESQNYFIFNSLWKKLDERYAVFAERLPAGKLWADIGKSFCSKITSEMTENELYNVLFEMIKELKDGHTYISADAIGRSDDTRPPYKELNIVEKFADNIRSEYLLSATIREVADGKILWGKIKNVGYLSISSLSGFSKKEQLRSDLKEVRKAMRQIVPFFNGVDGVIVDIRSTEGGYDEVALAIAKYFSGKRALAWRKQKRGSTGSKFSNFSSIFVEESPKEAIGGKIIVLTSPATFSAGETLAVALSRRDNVTILGEPTSGHFSDEFSFQLSNGWKVFYSGERYIDHRGAALETRGVPLNFYVPFDEESRQNFLINRTDTQLEAALDSINSDKSFETKIPETIRRISNGYLSSNQMNSVEKFVIPINFSHYEINVE